MTWMSGPYLLQWIWVALIVVAALVFAARYIRWAFGRTNRHAGSGRECEGCPLNSNSGQDSQCGRSACDKDGGHTSCGCC